MQSKRLRLIFSDQFEFEVEALRRTCIQISPADGIRSVNDLALRIINEFGLENQCSGLNALILSIDGFVVLPKQGISVFRDDEIIEVRKSGVGKKWDLLALTMSTHQYGNEGIAEGLQLVVCVRWVCVVVCSKLPFQVKNESRLRWAQNYLIYQLQPTMVPTIISKGQK